MKFPQGRSPQAARQERYTKVVQEVSLPRRNLWCVYHTMEHSFQTQRYGKQLDKDKHWSQQAQRT